MYSYEFSQQMPTLSGFAPPSAILTKKGICETLSTGEVELPSPVDHVRSKCACELHTATFLIRLLARGGQIASVKKAAQHHLPRLDLL